MEKVKPVVTERIEFEDPGKSKSTTVSDIWDSHDFDASIKKRGLLVKSSCPSAYILVETVLKRDQATRYCKVEK